MPHLNIRTGLLVLAAALGLMLTSAAQAQTAPQPGMIRMQEYHVRYDIRPDYTYTETGRIRATILDVSGLGYANEVPVGGDMFPGNLAGTREIKISVGYLLKKDGQKIPAQLYRASKTGMQYPSTDMQFLSFPGAEVGDTVVVSYQIEQKKPVPANNNVVLFELLPPVYEYGDVEFTVSTPEHMQLRADNKGIGEPQTTHSGGRQVSVWKYHSAGRLLMTGPDAMPRLHLTSFADMGAEQQAMLKQAQSTPLAPTPENLRCALMPGRPTEGPEARNLYSSMLAAFFFDARHIDQQFTDWNSPNCVFDDGIPMLAVLGGDAMSNMFVMRNDWDKGLARINELKKATSGRPYLAIAESAYWKAYAWNARGGGYASSVTRDGWKLYGERLEKAAQVLRDSKSYAASSPAWYDQMVDIQGAMSASREELGQTFAEGAKKFPTYYQLYFTMGNYLMPKWGGSWDDLERFAQWSVTNTKDMDGTSMYARIYWSVSRGLGEDETLFGTTRASWPKMKKGFEDLMERHPKSKWNLNAFAKFACMAGDKKTFLALRKRIGKDVMDKAWEDLTLELCEAKYGA